MNRLSNFSFRVITMLIIPLFLAMAGCACFKYHPGKITLTENEARELLEGLDRPGKIGSLRGDVKLKIYGVKNLLPQSQFMIVRQPDAMRLESFGPMGQLVFVLNLFKDRLDGAIIARNVFFSGPADSEYLDEIIPGGLEPAEFIDFLLGRLPIKPCRITEAFEYSKTNRMRIVTVTEKGFRQEIIAGRDPFRPIEVSIFSDDGRRIWRASLDKFSREGDYDFPLARRLEVGKKEAGFYLEFSRLELNPSLSDALFRLEPPPGMEVLPLKEGLLL